MRLKEERERLGLSQEKFGSIGGVLKRAQINYENGERSPDSAYMAAIASAGVDVLYVLTGQRVAAMPAENAAEQVLLDSFRRCAAQAQQHLIQTAALLAAGVGSPQSEGARSSAPQWIKQSAKDNAVQIGGNVTTSNINTEGSSNDTRRVARKPKGQRE